MTGREMLMSLFLLLLQLLLVLRQAEGYNISKPNCIDHCGDVLIPYPFGVGANCYHDASYSILCNASFNPPRPFLGQFNLEVLDISWPRRYASKASNFSRGDSLLSVSIPPMNLCSSDGPVSSLDFRGTPYQFSTELNVLKVDGCGGDVVLKNKTGEILCGCASVCASNSSEHCNGAGCCQASLLSSPSASHYQRAADNGLDFYEIGVKFEHQVKSNSCNLSAAFIEMDPLRKLLGSGTSVSNSKIIPTVLKWQATYISPLQKHNVSCTDFTCSCLFPYAGNPYLPYGCQVVEECRHCRDQCQEVITSLNSYYWSYNYSCQNVFFRKAPVIGFSIGMGVMLLVLGCYWLSRFLKRRKEVKRKAIHFKRNGGLLLQQQMSSDEGIVETTKIFAVTELEKATDNFNDNRILGQGGQGTVYKGMLMDGRIVAIKKSKKVDESQVEQFINEVVILSQINHRNVVKLLGSCLETEVPMLVYEYIPNGTLYQHIHGQSEDFHITWKMRLQIAAESAGAVAYLHSSSSSPIYHRDIKSTNILLDDKYRAKVSDFGTSRAITIEQTHVTTAVLGTYGYLDPEYFQSNQFTEKSDVYSFGVVLVELITGKKPICPDGSGGWISLATEFLSQMEESRLLYFLDSRILEEGKVEEFMSVVKLARKCLNMNGKLRPTMKEVAVLLDGIRSSRMPVSKEPKPSESIHVTTEVLHSHNSSPLTERAFSIDVNDPPAWSVEVEPLMSSTHSD